MPGSGECPDFFPLPVDDDAAKVKWVFWGANNNYMLGSFDGQCFHKEAGPLPSHFGANRYAAQTFSGIPPEDGRRIQIAWMAGGQYPGMPFNQQMSLPVRLTLRTFPEGVRLCTLPVREVDRLHAGEKFTFSGQLKPGDNPLQAVRGELFDINLAAEPGTAGEIVLTVRGTPIRFNVKTRQLSCLGRTATIELIDGRLALRVLVDRSSIEIFTADGRATWLFASCHLSTTRPSPFRASAETRQSSIWTPGGWHRPGPSRSRQFMRFRIFLWSVTSALAGFLFGFDTVVISGAEQTIQRSGA